MRTARLPAAVAAGVLFTAVAAAAPTELPLWPGLAPGEKGGAGEERFAPPKDGEKPPVKRLENVTKPTITVYQPAKDKDTGTAVVIAPGGGYRILAWEHEGTQVAEWLQGQGVTAVLLKYRLRKADQPPGEPPVQALQDAQRALSVVRSKSKDWNIDPNRVGLLGFSAGGHLTLWAATNADKRAYDPVDEADKLSCRPDFMIPIYPGGVLDKATGAIKPEIRISKDTPPAFLAVSTDDKGSFDSTVKAAQALRDAGVSMELHVYSSGGHGFGMKASDKPYATWPKRVEDWLKAEGWLAAKK